MIKLFFHAQVLLLGLLSAATFAEEPPGSVDLPGLIEDDRTTFTVARVENPFARLIADRVTPFATEREDRFSGVAKGNLIVNQATGKQFFITDRGVHPAQSPAPLPGEVEPRVGTTRDLPDKARPDKILPWVYQGNGTWVSKLKREEYEAAIAGKDVFQARNEALERARPKSDPLVLDLGNNLIWLSGTSSGVRFDVNADPTRIVEYTGWITADDTGEVGDGFLVLDRNKDGVINNGSELFGMNEVSRKPNGFVVLAEFDHNKDGVIDPKDKNIWSQLQVWIDSDENGESATVELFTLDELQITSIDLKYLTDKMSVDTHGNALRERSTFKRRVNGVEVVHNILNVWFKSYNP